MTIVNQPFDMNLFLQKKIDAAAAMTYNELAQVLESKNPDTGKLYTALRSERLQDVEPAVGTGMLEDNIFIDREVAEQRGEPGHGGQVPEGLVPGLDLLPRPR